MRSNSGACPTSNASMALAAACCSAIASWWLASAASYSILYERYRASSLIRRCRSISNKLLSIFSTVAVSSVINSSGARSETSKMMSAFSPISLACFLSSAMPSSNSLRPGSFSASISNNTAEGGSAAALLRRPAFFFPSDFSASAASCLSCLISSLYCRQAAGGCFRLKSPSIRAISAAIARAAVCFQSRSCATSTASHLISFSMKPLCVNG
mmetsp:Transcript_209/g.514  ORF Transcript_209/g.514 Transcript_209/m.514 type:complete len:213 (+) Transcript_209:1849-2487(+)